MSTDAITTSSRRHTTTVSAEQVLDVQIIPTYLPGAVVISLVDSVNVWGLGVMVIVEADIVTKIVVGEIV